MGLTETIPTGVLPDEAGLRLIEPDKIESENPVTFADVVQLVEDLTEDHPQASAAIIHTFILEHEPELSPVERGLVKLVESLAGRNERHETRIKELEKLAMVDELTKFLNRRGFNMTVLPHLHELMRERDPNDLDHERKHSTKALLVFFFDMNGLKRINDQLSHEAGDEALRTLCDAIKRGSRDTDIHVRGGEKGDELWLVMPLEDKDTPIDNILSRLQSSLKDLTFQAVDPKHRLPRTPLDSKDELEEKERYEQQHLIDCDLTAAGAYQLVTPEHLKRYLKEDDSGNLKKDDVSLLRAIGAEIKAVDQTMYIHKEAIHTARKQAEAEQGLAPYKSSPAEKELASRIMSVDEHIAALQETALVALAA